MKLIPFLIPLICMLFLACNKTDISHIQSTNKMELVPFPEGWVGIWEGSLKIHNANGKKREIPMSLDIQPIKGTPDYTWNIIYGEDKVAGLRPYRLTPVDPSIGHYIIDEENGISLDNYYLDGLLTSTYEVMGNLITCNNRIVNGRLQYEILFGSIETPRITGDTIIGQDTIPKVSSFRTSGLQKASLVRKKTLSN